MSKGLVLLRWIYFQQKTLPLWLSLKNLTVLELHRADNLEELWGDEADPPLELRELIVTCGSSRLVSIPRSIGRLKHFKKISLAGSNFPLGFLPEEFCLLQSLEHLKLLNFHSLASLPTKFGDLRNLRHLGLSGCHELRMLPVSFNQLIHLEYINLENCSKLTFISKNVDILGNMTKLEILNFGGCKVLEELPLLPYQGALRELHLHCMLSLEEIPRNIGQLSKLQKLKIGSPYLKILPTSLGNLSSLNVLEIEECNKLEYLPRSIGKLSSLTTLHIIRCSNLKSLPHTIGKLSSLTTFHIIRCSNLISLPHSIRNLSSLTTVYISLCSKLKSLPHSIGNLSFLTLLSISGCSKLESLPESLGNLSSLTRLSNLQSLRVDSCPIRHLPFLSFSSSLSNLKYIELCRTRVSRISISQQCCPGLETLQVQWNDHLIEIKALPISVKALELKSCKKLKSLSGICGLVNLQKLVVLGCEDLMENGRKLKA